MNVDRFPRALVVEGPRPETDAVCTVCRLHYTAHTGATCALCSCPIEHHDEDELPAELSAYALLAEAKLAGGHELTPAEEYALDQVRKATGD